MSEPVYSREQIEQWQQQLEAIAQQPRTTFTKKQAVEELFETIEKALETRSYEEVAKALTKNGLEVSPGSLKHYVSKCRSANGHAAMKRERPTTKKARETAREESPSRQGQKVKKEATKATVKTPLSTPKKRPASKLRATRKSPLKSQ